MVAVLSASRRRRLCLLSEVRFRTKWDGLSSFKPQEVLGSSAEPLRLNFVS